METLQIFNYDEAQKIALAIQAGQHFYIKNGNATSAVYPSEAVYHFSADERAKIDEALAKSALSAENGLLYDASEVFESLQQSARA